MKTCHAFALRNYSREKILQRPFFRGMHFDADKTDTEILQELRFSDGDSLAELEYKQETLKKLFRRLEDFSAWIDNHVDKRLGKYMRVMKKKIESAKQLDAELLEAKLAREEYLVFHYSLNIPDDIANLIYSVGMEEDAFEEPLEEAYSKRFGERLRKARIEAGLTRQQLGAEINLSPNGFGQYETGRREPSITSLLRLSRKLNVSVDWLIGATP